MTVSLKLYAVVLAASVCLVSPSVDAQEMVQTFRDPGFGGNPFNTDYLKATAEYSRPQQTANTPSADDLLASQIRSQLTSTLSADILTRIQTATPGESGSFTLGTQKIDYSRSQTETVVTFTNTVTGVTSKLVIPVAKPRTSFSVSPGQSNAALSGSSAEQALGAIGTAAEVSPSKSATTGVVGLELSLGPPPL